MVSINPKLVCAQIPYVRKGISENFEVQVSYQVLDIMKNHPSFEVHKKRLESCLLRLGYRLSEDGIRRFAKTLQIRACRFKKYMSKIISKKKQDAYKENWWRYECRPGEVELVPLNTLEMKDQEIHELRECITSKDITNEDQADKVLQAVSELEDLQKKMKVLEKENQHKGKAFGEVCSRQQLRHFSLLR